MGRRSSVLGDFVHVKTVAGLERFKVGKSRNSYDVPFRSYSIEFEKNRSFTPCRWGWGTMVGNSRHSYDVLFKSCLGNSRYRAVNSIPKAAIYFNVSRMTQSVTSTTRPPKVSTPFLPGREVKWVKGIQKGPLNFFIFRYVKGGVLGNNNISIKNCRTTFLWE